MERRTRLQPLSLEKLTDLRARALRAGNATVYAVMDRIIRERGEQVAV
tara:strand:+ start:1433 stop:1576 length:144 start_codon:yes stop_codon:yes gene_type:complete